MIVSIYGSDNRVTLSSGEIIDKFDKEKYNSTAIKYNYKIINVKIIKINIFMKKLIHGKFKVCNVSSALHLSPISLRS